MKKRMTLMCVLCGIVLFSSFVAAAENERLSNDPNAYTGTDSERIEKAIQASPQHGGIVQITQRLPDENSSRTFWLLDKAVLLPENTTLMLINCTLKLSDQCRDNFIRTANCGIGIEKVSPVKNIHIVGCGQVELIGADHPRSTGDSVKVLGQRTYGTDAGKPNEKPKGGWRNIGILLARVENFSIKNITIRQPHCWSISLEKCSFGTVSDITFDATETYTIDNKKVAFLNQDGLDLRKGCHDIMIENIRGRTGDDLVALTAISPKAKKGGVLESTEVSESDPNAMNDIYNVTIRNISGYSAGGHQIVRFLNASGIKIHHVILDGLIDTSPSNIVDNVTIRIGDSNPAWGGVTPLGDTYGFIINNVQSRSREAILIAGSLCDSVINNVINYNPKVTGVKFGSGEKNVRNVTITNFLTPLF